MPVGFHGDVDGCAFMAFEVEKDKRQGRLTDLDTGNAPRRTGEFEVHARAAALRVFVLRAGDLFDQAPLQQFGGYGRNCGAADAGSFGQIDSRNGARLSDFAQEHP